MIDDTHKRSMRPRGIDWNRQPLGLVTDTELAIRLGVGQTAVSGARRRRGIPAVPRGRVERLGAQGLLGTMTDARLAAHLKLPQTAIRDARRRAGIRMDQPRISWTRIDPLLGTRSDSRIARQHNVSVSSIHARRVALDIEPHAPTRRCACGRDYPAYRDWMRHCSTICAYAGRYGRRRGGHETLSVALWALRREIRRHAHGKTERMAIEQRCVGGNPAIT